MSGDDDDRRKMNQDERIRNLKGPARATFSGWRLPPAKKSAAKGDDDGTWFLAILCEATELGRKITRKAEMYVGPKKDAALRRFWQEEEQDEGYNAVTETFLQVLVDRVMAWKKREIRH